MAQKQVAKKKTGRRANGELTERSQVRHAPGEWEAWAEHASRLGFGGASPWLRKLANDALAAAKANGTPS